MYYVLGSRFAKGGIFESFSPTPCFLSLLHSWWSGLMKNHHRSLSFSGGSRSSSRWIEQSGESSILFPFLIGGIKMWLKLGCKVGSRVLIKMNCSSRPFSELIRTLRPNLKYVLFLKTFFDYVVQVTHCGWNWELFARVDFESISYQILESLLSPHFIHIWTLNYTVGWILYFKTF